MIATESPGKSDTDYSGLDHVSSTTISGAYKEEKKRRKKSIQEDSISSIYEPIRN